MFKSVVYSIFLFLLITNYPIPKQLEKLAFISAQNQLFKLFGYKCFQLFATDSPSQKIDSKSIPSAIVIFGATGDLTARKVIPAIYNLAQNESLSKNTVIVGIGRREYTDLTFRAQMRAGVDKFSKTKVSDASWKDFENKLFYHRLNFESDEGYENLQNCLLKLDREFGTQGNRIFYLATQPSSFAEIIEKLHAHKLIYDPKISKEKWSKVIIEKPFGHDLESAIQLQTHIGKYLDENQIYRIDHYLGKIGVQNLYTLRFENVLFEPIWNNQYIDNVQITISEQIGIGPRAHFWEETGLLSDIFQNHLLQLLSIFAMEPPRSFNSRDIRREKIKLLKAMRPFPTEEIDQYVVRGQYAAGKINDIAVPGYRQEKDVPKDSQVETFVAAKIFIDNDRWQGVPFYIRSGKRLVTQTTEIIVTFKKEAQIYQKPNSLIIRIQPNAGVFLRILSKVPELETNTDSVIIGYQFDPYFGKSSPEAYEKLLYDCIIGDSSAFVDAEEQIAAWNLLVPIIKHWKIFPPTTFPNYAAGSWGPEEADILIGSDGREWQRIEN